MSPSPIRRTYLSPFWDGTTLSPIVAMFDVVPPGYVWTVSIMTTVSQILTPGAQSPMPAGKATRTDLLQDVVWTLYRNNAAEVTWIGYSVPTGIQLFGNDNVTVVGSIPAGISPNLSGVAPLTVSITAAGYAEEEATAQLVLPSLSTSVEAAPAFLPVRNILTTFTNSPVAVGPSVLGPWAITNYQSISLNIITGASGGVNATLSFYSDPAGTNQIDSQAWSIFTSQTLDVLVPANGVSAKLTLTNLNAGSIFASVTVTGTTIPVTYPTYQGGPYIGASAIIQTLNAGASQTIQGNRIMGGKSFLCIVPNAFPGVLMQITVNGIDSQGNFIGQVYSSVFTTTANSQNTLNDWYIAPPFSLQYVVKNASSTNLTQVDWYFVHMGTN